MRLSKKGQSALCLCTTAAIGLFATAATAQVSPTGPFVGDIQESWESFDNYLEDPDFNMDEPTVCFGGGAAIADGGQMICWETDVATFGLCEPGQAAAVDGTQGHGLNTGPDATATITFDPPVCAFGGYWGAANGCGGAYDGIIEFAFMDASGNVIGTGSLAWNDTDGDGYGQLQWAGWTSTTAIAAVSYRGDFVVNDYLQASYDDCDGGGGEEKCKGDGNGDGVVDVNDLLGLLAAWGPCPSANNCDVGFVCGGDIPWCTDDQTCVCVTRADGTGVDCVLVVDFLCSSACVTDADCEPGRSCYIDTCCTDGVCGTPCPEGSAPINIEADPTAINAITGNNSSNFTKRSLTPAGNHQQVDDFNPDCPYDFNGDGVVDVNDLLSLLANWGPCPVVFEDCEVGFVCGDPLIICGEFEGFDCACFTHFSGVPICVANSSCANPVCPNGDVDCPPGFLCTIDTCCAENVCLEDCGGNQVGPCDVGFTCGDQLTVCPPGGDPTCFCWTSFNGGTVCGHDGACGTTCFDGICPTGMVCVIDTCCSEPSCIVACDGQGGGFQCDVGFVCGGEIPWCNDAQTCACFTLIGGGIECCQGGPCDTPCQSDADCPAGAVCAIDTCCGEPICAFLCQDGSPEGDVNNRDLPSLGIHDDGAIRASGN